MKILIVIKDVYGNLEVKYDFLELIEFEVKLDFGVGVVVFCFCDG